ncbi:T9SS type A sorting domain-containing protein [Winogradskyella thalassocola]|uniref:Por secretion system C-terminal sorting domain-containing protein n=1 Tax=Winogradskyella thalassocola TaxID=262004 RepID=A0A1G8E4Z3_9FLAO|nr:T9SS type A sorting domain-containing protein [Winogradskyella thalassocola]SDH65016.1 Por secretion system C-terminal sorting domain-containing protein [Winogradskyella thalassocola]
MKNYFPKKWIGHISLCIKSKSFKIRSTIIVFASLLLTGSAPQAVYGYDGNAANGWTILNNLNLTDGKLIAPGQGFFVKNKPGGGSIEFTPEMRIGGSSDDFILGRGTTSSAHIGYLKLKSSALDSEYTTDFYFNTNATSGLDPGYDAALYNSNVPAFAIYSYLVEDSTGIPFMIQTLGEAALNDVTITLGVHAVLGQEVTISIEETDMPDTVNVYLEDTSNNTSTLLNTNDYTFTAIDDLTGVGRFYIRFENDVLNINNATFDALKISTNQVERTIEVIGQLETQTSFGLYDIHGHCILKNDLDVRSVKQSVDVSHLSTGIYIVELETVFGNRRIQKLIIR